MVQNAFLVSSEDLSLEDIEAIARPLYPIVEIERDGLIVELHGHALIRIYRQPGDKIGPPHGPEDIEEYRALLKAEPVCCLELYPLSCRRAEPWALLRDLLGHVMRRHHCIVYEDLGEKFHTLETLPDQFWRFRINKKPAELPRRVLD